MRRPQLSKCCRSSELNEWLRISSQQSDFSQPTLNHFTLSTGSEFQPYPLAIYVIVGQKLRPWLKHWRYTIPKEKGRDDYNTESLRKDRHFTVYHVHVWNLFPWEGLGNLSSKYSKCIMKLNSCEASKKKIVSFFLKSMFSQSGKHGQGS